MHERCEFCGKKNYPTRQWAAAMAMVQKYDAAHPYHCPQGEFWHLKTPRHVKRKYKQVRKRFAGAMRRLYEERSNNDVNTGTQPEKG